MHWQGGQHYFHGIDQPHKHLFTTPPAHAERPLHQWHDEIIRWYDHWLKGIDNGVENDPAVRIWIMGENTWRTFNGWPVPETQWTKYYLHSWEKLNTKGHLAAHTYINEPPDAFVQMPPTQTNTIARLRYLTEPLAENTWWSAPSRSLSGPPWTSETRTGSSPSRMSALTFPCSRCGRASARCRPACPSGS